MLATFMGQPQKSPILRMFTMLRRIPIRCKKVGCEVEPRPVGREPMYGNVFDVPTYGNTVAYGRDEETAWTESGNYEEIDITALELHPSHKSLL